MSRLIRPLVIACFASYFTLVAFNNISDFHTNHVWVRLMLNMDGVPAEGVLWRAVTNPTLVLSAYLLVIGTEIVIASLAWWGIALILLKRGGHMQVMWALTLAFGLFMFGFITIGSEWFYLWQNPNMAGVNSKSATFAILMLSALIFEKQNAA